MLTWALQRQRAGITERGLSGGPPDPEILTTKASERPEPEVLVPSPLPPPRPPHRTEFGLDAFVSGADVIRAIRELGYKGGNTRTGAAILHVADRVFLPQRARPGVPKVTPRASPAGPGLGV